MTVTADQMRVILRTIEDNLAGDLSALTKEQMLFKLTIIRRLIKVVTEQ